MERRLGLSAWSLVGLVLLATLFTFMVVWATTQMSRPDAESALPWNWIVGAILIGGSLSLVAVRPILIPWTVVQTRRGIRRVFPKTARYEPPAPAFPIAPRPTGLAHVMDQAEEAARRAEEVQAILDVARAKEVSRPIELQVRR